MNGALLFLQHMIRKFEPVLPDQQKHGSRLAIVFSGSPLFTGGEGIEGQPDQIRDIVKLFGRFANTAKSKTFDNADLGYTRVTVERPLRLCYRLTVEDEAHFLDACPHLLDDLEAIDKALGHGAQRDWNVVLRAIHDVLRERDSKWRPPEHKLFRHVFTRKDPEAKPVTAKRAPMYGPTGSGPNPGQTRVGRIAPNEQDRLRGLFPDPSGKTEDLFQYEADPDLRDSENVPLKEVTA